mmetsp:Transcript_3236/g.8329  ORF Transcript_3236/g.8329 Transcript_3236/m.8329 type:complete len:241 (-) Transcript_3236:213-935(-)
MSRPRLAVVACASEQRKGKIHCGWFVALSAAPRVYVRERVVFFFRLLLPTPFSVVDVVIVVVHGVVGVVMGAVELVVVVEEAPPGTTRVVPTYPEIVVVVVVEGLVVAGILGSGDAGEIDDPFEMFVHKEVVEGPEAAVGGEGIGIEVWYVGIDVAVGETDGVFDRRPDLVEKGLGQVGQLPIDGTGDDARVRLARKLLRPQRRKIVVWKARVQRGDEVDQETPRPGVAQGAELRRQRAR